MTILILIVVVVLTIGPYLIPLPPAPDASPEAFARPGGRFASADGTRTWIQEAGPPDGPAVVFLHGFGGSTFSWRDTLGPVGAAGFHAVALDLRGFGLSDKSLDADYSRPAQARFVLAARLAIVADSGHLPFEEQPGAFLAALLPYLEERR